MVFRIAVIILGNRGVGKTRLLLALAGVHATSSSATPQQSFELGDFLTRLVSVDASKAPVKLELWHTAGQEKFGAGTLASAFFRRARAAVIVYDVADYQSFQAASDWVDRVREQPHHDGSLPIVLVAIGDVTEKEVTTEEGQELARKIGASAFVECFPTSQAHVDKCLRSLAELLAADVSIRQRLDVDVVGCTGRHDMVKQDSTTP